MRRVCCAYPLREVRAAHGEIITWTRYSCPRRTKILRPNHGDAATAAGVTAALLGLTLFGGTVGGSAAGATVMARWLATREVAAASNGGSAASVTQPTLQTAQGNVAGAVLQAVGPSVVEITIAGQAGYRQAVSGTGSALWSTPAA